MSKMVIILLTMTIVFVPKYSISQNATKISIGGDVGYFFPLGEWTEHRFADGIDQFQAGYTIFPEIEIKFSDLSVGIFYNYGKLSTTDWEDYVQSEGNNITASASLSNLGGFLRYFFLQRNNHYLNIEIGMSYVFLDGQETYYAYTYEYDFLNPGIGFLIGCGYRYALSNRLAVTFNSRFLWKPEGIKYSEGKTYDIFGVYLTPGIRIIF